MSPPVPARSGWHARPTTRRQKAAIIGLTASLAKELGPSGILVSAVAPTQILTSRDGVPSIPEERATDLAKKILLRRIATPEDLASLVLWLGSAANGYVTGEAISPHGATSARVVQRATISTLSEPPTTSTSKRSPRSAQPTESIHVAVAFGWVASPTIRP